MTKTEQELKDAEGWCEDTRKILRQTISSKLAAFFATDEFDHSLKALNNVKSKLEALEGKRTSASANAYEELSDKFYNVSKLLGEGIGQTKDKSLALTLTAQLVHLGNCIDEQLVTPGANVAASLLTLTAAVNGIYTAELIVAKKKEKELKDKSTLAQNETFYGGTFTFEGQIPTLIANAETAASNPTNSAESVTQAIKILAGVEKEFTDGNALHTAYVAYKAKMDLAEKHRVELFLLKAGTTDYSSDFKTAILDARRAATNTSSGTHNFVAAGKKLDAVILNYKSRKKEAADDEAKKSAEAKEKPIYDDKVRRIKNDIRELEKLPGTKSAVTELERLLALGEAEVTTPKSNYKLAREKLHGSKQANIDGKAAADNFDKTMNPDYRLKRAEAESKLSEVEKLVGRSQFEDIAKYQKLIHDSLMRLSNLPLELNNEKVEITRIIAELETLANIPRLKRLDCESEKAIATQGIKEFQERYLIANYNVLPLFRQAESAFAVDNYDEAKTLYEGVTSRLSEILGGGDDLGYVTWNTNLTAFKTNYPILENVRYSGCEYLKKIEHEGVQLIQLEAKATPLIENLKLTRDYLAANEIAAHVARVINDINIVAILQEYNSTKVTRVKLGDDTEVLMVAAKNKIKELGAAPLFGYVEPFEEIRETLEAGWKNTLDRSDTILNETQLDTAFTTFEAQLKHDIHTPIEAMLSAFKKNKDYEANPKDLSKVLNTDEQLALQQLTASKKAADIVIKAETFEADLARISATIMLMKKDASAYTSLTAIDFDAKSAELNTIKSEVTTALASNPLPSLGPLNDRVNTLKQNLDDVIKELDGKRVTRRAEANVEIEKCSAILNPLKAQNPNFAPYFKPLTGRIEDLKAMASSEIWTTVDQCVKAATQWETELKRSPTLEEKFTTINRLLGEIETGIENKVLEKHLPERLNILKMRFEKINPVLYKDGPFVRENEVTALRNDFNTADGVASVAEAVKLEITDLAKRCRDELAKITDAKKLKESFEAMITSASTYAEGFWESAKLRLKGIEQQIQNLVGPDAAEVRLQMEQSTRAQENTAKLQTTEFDSKLEVFNGKQIKEVDKLKNDTGPDNVNSDLYNKMVKLRDDAIQMRSQGHVETAIEKLGAARTAAERFLMDPLSKEINARNNLKNVGDDWLKTISTFVKSMSDLKAAVKSSMEAENALSRANSLDEKFNSNSFKAMEEPLTEAARSFEANKFPDYIKAMLLANEAANVKEYRALKEDALRFVRTYQNIVTKDPVLLSAASNPFQVVVSVRSVKEALRVLELNLSRA